MSDDPTPTPPQIAANVANVNVRVAAGSYDLGSLLTTWTDVVHIDFTDDNGVIDSTPGADTNPKIGKNFLYEAQKQSYIPNMGNPHPIYPHTYCQSVRVEPATGSSGNSPVSVNAYVTWIQPTINSNNFNNVKIECDVFQTQEISNFDKNGVLTAIYYALPTNYTPDEKKYWTPFRIADIRLQKLMKSFRIILYEDFQDGLVGGNTPGPGASLRAIAGVNLTAQAQGKPTPRPFYNEDEIWGFDKFTLLFVGRRATNDGTQIYRTEYQYLINEWGWNHYYGVYENQNGTVPRGVVKFPDTYRNPNTPAPDLAARQSPALNGIGVFDMLLSAKFADVFNTIHVPGNAVGHM